MDTQTASAWTPREACLDLQVVQAGLAVRSVLFCPSAPQDHARHGDPEQSRKSGNSVTAPVREQRPRHNRGFFLRMLASVLPRPGMSRRHLRNYRLGDINCHASQGDRIAETWHTAPAAERRTQARLQHISLPFVPSVSNQYHSQGTTFNLLQFTSQQAIQQEQFMLVRWHYYYVMWQCDVIVSRTRPWPAQRGECRKRLPEGLWTRELAI